MRLLSRTFRQPQTAGPRVAIMDATATGKADSKPRGAAKSASAFRTISEVSTELDVPQHVLRFWESKFPQVRPLKRGGGRRYYRPEDVELLRHIQRLLYKEGYTIKGVQRLLRETRGVPPGAEDLLDDRDGLGDGEGDEAAGQDSELADDEVLVPGDGKGSVVEGPSYRPSLSGLQRAAVESVIAELQQLRDLLRAPR